MSGDGGLSMLMGDLLTIASEKLPVKTVVFNNSTLGMVRLEMLVDGLPFFGTDVNDVNYADIATACGIHSVRITDPAQLRQQMAEALAHPGPVLIDVVTDPDALSIPPHITFDMLLGFSKAATKTVFDGGVGAMLSLAESNLRNIPKP